MLPNSGTRRKGGGHNCDPHYFIQCLTLLVWTLEGHPTYKKILHQKFPPKILCRGGFSRKCLGEPGPWKMSTVERQKVQLRNQGRVQKKNLEGSLK